MNLKTVFVAFLMYVSAAAQAAPMQLLSNGGFETGDLTGWSTSGLGSPTGLCPSEGRDWNVSNNPSATGCTPAGAPIEGQFAAYVMNDGGTGPATPLTYVLSQAIAIPIGVTSSALSFSFSSVSAYSAVVQRTFSVEVLDSSNTLLATLFSFDVPFNDGDTSWDAVGVDVSALLAAQGGATLTLRFTNTIVDAWTGPAGLAVDQVSLLATTATVPEPGTVLLVALAFLAIARRGVVRR